jgi:putative peptidoglycan lipid II flippase
VNWSKEPGFGKRPQLKHVALVLGFSTGVFMVLRFAEQYLLARRFGPSHTLDAYFVAQTIILVGSQCAVAVTSAGVPIITSGVIPGNQPIQKADLTIIACVLSVCFVAAILLMVGAPIFVAVLGPGLDRHSSELAQFLLRCSVPAAMLSIIAAAFRAHWHSHNHLLTPGILQLLMPFISTSLALLVAFNFLGIEWVPLGAGLGALLFTAALARPFFHNRNSEDMQWNSEVAKEFVTALFPVCLAMVLVPCMVAVGRLFASRLHAGNVSALSVAASLMSIPGQLAATSVGMAILPRTSSFLSDKRQGEAAALIDRALRITVFCSIPFVATFALYPDRIVRMLFHGGSFDAQGVALTSIALRGYCFGIPALAVVQVLVFGLFASSMWRQVAGVTIISVLLNGVLSALFSNSILGLSAVFSTTCYISAAMLTVLLKRRIAHLSATHLLISSGRAAAAAAVAFVGVNFAFGHLLPQLSYLVPMSVSFIGYIGLAGLFCRSETRELISIFDRKKASHITRVNDEATLVSGAS